MKMFNKKKNPEPGRATSSVPRADVFSYYSSRSRTTESVGRGETTKSVNKPTLLNHFPTILGGMAIIVCLVYLMTLNPRPRVISFADKTPNLLQEHSIYGDYVAGLMTASVWNRFKMTADTGTIADQLKKQFPELADVSVVIPLASRRPILELQPAEPVLLITSEQGAALVGNDGRALMEARQAPSDLIKDLPQVNDESRTVIKTGEYALTKEKVRFIKTVTSQLEQSSLNIENIVLPTLPHELHVRVRGEGYYIKFHMLGDARLQSGAYLAVRENLGDSEPGDYIDVRLEDKVYYR